MRNYVKEMENLISVLNVHIHNYYVLDKPTISDYEYDQLYDKLIKLEKESGIVLPFSPSLRVGGQPLKEFESFVHDVPLYSLDKCQNFEDLDSWVVGIKKEFKDILRDRKTLLMTFVIPIIIMPLLFTFIFSLLLQEARPVLFLLRSCRLRRL